MKWGMGVEAAALYEAGYAVKRTAEWFVTAPSKAAPEFKRQLRTDRGFYFMVPCAKGRKVAGVKAHVYPFSGTELAFTGFGRRLQRTLVAIPGVRAHQTGDDEFTVVFPTERLAAVAEVVGPRRRRKNSPVAGSFKGQFSRTPSPNDLGDVTDA